MTPDEINSLALDYLARTLRGEEIVETVTETIVEYTEEGARKLTVRRAPMAPPKQVLVKAYEQHCNSPSNRTDVDIVLRVVTPDD